MSENPVVIRNEKSDSKVDENVKDDLEVRCTNSIESKSELEQEGEVLGRNVSSGDDETTETEDLTNRVERHLDKFETTYTQDEIELNWKLALELKIRGNDEYKRQKYIDSVTTYTDALRICPPTFVNERSILYANRAAAYINIDKNTRAIEDCTKSIQLNEYYVKAYLRRAKIYEELDKLDESLEDFKKALDVDPSCSQAQSGCERLEPKLYEKNEKLKVEMLGKLKDLGNLVLRPFGLSTDNFKLEQNSETGGYSINFKQSSGGT